MQIVSRIATADQLGPHLRSFRKARKLTQRQLGDLLGVKQARVADIETNPGSISVAQLVRLLSVLGVEIVLHDKGAGWTAPTAADDLAGTGQKVGTDKTAAATASGSPKNAKPSPGNPAKQPALSTTSTPTPASLDQRRNKGEEVEEVNGVMLAARAGEASAADWKPADKASSIPISRGKKTRGVW